MNTTAKKQKRKKKQLILLVIQVIHAKKLILKALGQEVFSGDFPWLGYNSRSSINKNYIQAKHWLWKLPEDETIG